MTAPIQVVSSELGGVTTLQVTINNVGANNTLVIGAGANHAIAPVSITDSAGGNITAGAAWATNAAGVGHGSYCLFGAAAGTHVITITFGSSSAIVMTVAEYPTAAAGSLDKASAVATGTGATLASNSVTPSGSGDLAVAFLFQNQGGSTFSGLTAGYTQENLWNTSLSLVLADQTLAAGATSCGATSSKSTGAWAASVTLFKDPVVGVTQTASSLKKWIPFRVACRLRCLRQGSLNVGNTQQNKANLLSLCTGSANGTQAYGKWDVTRAAGTNPEVYLLVYPANVPGFVSPPAI